MSAKFWLATLTAILLSFILDVFAEPLIATDFEENMVTHKKAGVYSNSISSYSSDVSTI